MEIDDLLREYIEHAAVRAGGFDKLQAGFAELALEHGAETDDRFWLAAGELMHAEKES